MLVSLSLLLVLLLSLFYTFNFLLNRSDPQKTHKPPSYVDSACQTSDLDLAPEQEPDLVHTPTTLETNECLEDLEDLDFSLGELASLNNAIDGPSIPPNELLSKILVYNPITRLTYFIPENDLPCHPEGLEIPVSVLNRLCKCALESFEAETKQSHLDEAGGRGNISRATEILNSVKMAFYILEDGSCEVLEDTKAEVPHGWVRVPERVIEFLADEVVRWDDAANPPGPRG
ncbi:hypothetical protein TWF718_002214 [Orbilia javanica]|uniref:Uncharacterized protein n=1 Tax=Orbilia javanica TaxID=47235 RepID=A0AAN8RJK2_9PEZI